MDTGRREIRILPDDLVNKIAAGEVVERPLNVVKELVENALDAGATEIAIDIEDGGRRRIAVTDNGCGMSRKGMALALARHATSKLATLDDLFAITTLGFRGEALPAIASVSRFGLVSKEDDGDAAHRMEWEGGKLVLERPEGRATGTAVEVRDLFFNTPARLKFMKSPATEWAHILDYASRAALSFPDVTFHVSHDGKPALDISKRGEGSGRLSQILGDDVGRQGCFFEDHDVRDADYACRGWLGFPSLTRKGPSGLYLFVNRRPIRDKVIQHALAEAYQGLVMKGRFPVAVLHLGLPAAEVDVNVHPTKSEVRFRDSGKIHQWIYRSVRTVLQGQPWIKREVALPIVPQVVSSDGPGGWPGEVRSIRSATNPETGAERMSRIFTGQDPPVGEFLFSASLPSIIQPTSIAYDELSLIGQLHGTYLLCEARERLILVDQHAAHERVGFEELKAAYAAHRLAAEPLLVPLHFDLLPSDAAILEPALHELEALGVEIARFGGNTFVIQAVPSLLKDANWNELIGDVIEDLKEFGTLSGLDEHVDDLLATMACHKQVRAHDRLEREEMQALLSQLGAIDFAYTCPHGRPAAVEVSLAEIEKWFKRRL